MIRNTDSISLGLKPKRPCNGMVKNTECHTHMSDGKATRGTNIMKDISIAQKFFGANTLLRPNISS